MNVILVVALFMLGLAINHEAMAQAKCVGKKCRIAKVQAPAPPEQVTFKLGVGVIRGNNEVVPIARTAFVFATYSRTEIRKELQVREGIPPEPAMEAAYMRSHDLCMKVADVMQQTALRYGRSAGATEERFHEYAAKVEPQINLCFKNTKKAIATRASWEKIAWAGEDEQVQAVSMSSPPTQTAITDLHGETTVTLPVGKWYITGTSKFGQQIIKWVEVPFEVKSGMTKFELSNDNAAIIK